MYLGLGFRVEGVLTVIKNMGYTFLFGITNGKFLRGKMIGTDNV